jgi:hypothetical protein
MGDTPERSISARPACARMFFRSFSKHAKNGASPHVNFGTRVSLCRRGWQPDKEVNDLFKYFLKAHSVALTLIKLQAGGFICHSLAHPHVTQSFPELIDLGRYHFVRLFNINQMRNRHPTSSAGNPEYF